MRVHEYRITARQLLIVTAITALAIAACSGEGESAIGSTPFTTPVTTPAPEPDPAFDVERAVAWARQFGSLVSSGRIEEAAGLFAPDWVKVGIQMTEGGWGIVPPGDQGGAFGDPAPLVDGLGFIAAWMDVELEGCAGTTQGASRVSVRCVATLSGPYPEAMDLEPFELPVVFSATADGLTEYGTDFTAVESGRFAVGEATETYLSQFPKFVVYTMSQPDFASTYTRGSGRPVIASGSAAAHIEMAKEWVTAGKP